MRCLYAWKLPNEIKIFSIKAIEKKDNKAIVSSEENEEEIIYFLFFDGLIFDGLMQYKSSQ